MASRRSADHQSRALDDHQSRVLDAARPGRRSGRPDRVTFAVERFWPGVGEPAVVAAAEATRQVSVAMQAEGRSIRLLDTFMVREEQVVVTVFAAASAAVVREAVERAGLPFDRITRLDRPAGGRAPADRRAPAVRPPADRRAPAVRPTVAASWHDQEHEP